MQFEGTLTDLAFAAAPKVNAIFPEYLTDPSIYICPSDPNGTVDYLKWTQEEIDQRSPIPPGPDPQPGDWQIGYTGGPIWADLGVRRTDASYVYFGWFLDLLADDPALLAAPSAFPMLEQFITIPPETENLGVPIQLAKGLENAALSYFGMGDNPDENAIDNDIECIYEGTPYGNGNGRLIYRLREGIERFAITDINNPGASAQAQSNIFVMFDIIAADSQNFNHIPGGSNVLYMDGHVEFLKYPVQQPINRVVAVLVGGFFD